MQNRRNTEKMEIKVGDMFIAKSTKEYPTCICQIESINSQIPNGIVVRWHEGTGSTHGWTKKEIQGKNWIRLSPVLSELY